uniref:Ribosomal protein L32 n=1 Tax=Magallana gigas TaxID=29159 RepID=A0A8W8MP43_MAGGI
MEQAKVFPSGKYKHAGTTKMNVENLNSKSQTKLIQNKTGNKCFHRRKGNSSFLVSK